MWALRRSPFLPPSTKSDQGAPFEHSRVIRPKEAQLKSHDSLRKFAPDEAFPATRAPGQCMAELLFIHTLHVSGPASSSLSGHPDIFSASLIWP